MIDINAMIQKEIENGYGDANAQSKVCQDLILKAISASTLNRNVTIKGGVVMRSKTGNVRRATQDIDLDFIRYSLADEAIDAFIRKLNCLDGITVERVGEIKEQFFKGYHISKGNWVSILLDGTVAFDEICNLLDESYVTTASKQKKQKIRPPKEWIVPANPKYYDIVHAFDDTDEIDWKQGAGIKAGDTVFIYAVPEGYQTV